MPIGDPQIIESTSRQPAARCVVTYAVADFASGSANVDRKVQVIVDPNNTVDESSESDNKATATLAMIEEPIANLMITSDNISFSDPRPVEGDTVCDRLCTGAQRRQCRRRRCDDPVY